MKAFLASVYFSSLKELLSSLLLFVRAEMHCGKRLMLAE